MKFPHQIIIQPHITEKTAHLSYGDPRLSEQEVQRKYTFVVAPDANKIEIKRALEEIYNAGKKKDDEKIVVEKVATVNVKGKSRRVGFKNKGKRPNWKKAVITLAKGQMLEDYGV